MLIVDCCGLTSTSDSCPAARLSSWWLGLDVQPGICPDFDPDNCALAEIGLKPLQDDRARARNLLHPWSARCFHDEDIAFELDLRGALESSTNGCAPRKF